MNRNTQNHFATLPNVDISRSRFKRPFTHKTTFNTGDIIPLMLQEILPGDTVTMDMGAAIRMSTPIYPVMDNAFFDYYFFFVPNRLTWEHWEEFMGENKQTAWEQKTEYEIPQIKAPEGGWAKGTIADHMGIPTKVENISVSALPFRAYGLIYNEWFRDQNLKDPCMVNTDDTTQTGSNSGDYVINTQLGALPCKAAKYHDYFTSALPEPQKGPDVLLPQGLTAPVKTSSEYAVTPEEVETLPSLRWAGRGDDGVTTYTGSRRLVAYGQGATDYTMEGVTYLAGVGDSTEDGQYFPINLQADLSMATGATINQLRQAFAVQKFYEKQARGGSRYRETIRQMFGVSSPDARMQIPEYLGGHRQPINIDQVLQTSATDTTSPQGNTAAYSLTNIRDSVFTKSFVEHGYLMCLGVVRTYHTYQQGIDAHWSRKTLFDFYFPVFANLGEQPIYNKEIYATGTETDEEVFGYQEAWAPYRYAPARVSGAFRSNYEQTLDSWHYADYYEEQPILSSDWIDETRANVNRTIAVQDELEDQFIGDFYFAGDWVRPLPIYSIPGLIDHH
ncbi:major capsid protein [Alces alces faeces associated microvirus MP10 5560]|uniref:major capsid protein n=1 Tax=Alces alces faeces associated microvirus MP10 5560 TaxID=2219133 RepID=UPI000DF096D5|nr:major capsid protein [Alces alces faeces associated microvirus MP10 5560]AXB22562.1 major capsid protein [Alces alces faeces associated microvirus MP10 5560]